jgi:hypothetical protein
MDEIITDLQDLHRRVTDDQGDATPVTPDDLTEVVADLIADVIWLADEMRKTPK